MSKSSEITVVPRPELARMPGWGELDADERQAVALGTQGCFEAMVEQGMSRLSLGIHLLNVCKVLKPRRLFVWWLREVLGIVSVRTAYRYMDSATNFMQHVPDERIRQALMARGIDFSRPTKEKPLGLYTDAVRRTPFPDPTDTEALDTYAKRLEDGKKRALQAAAQPAARTAEQMKREVYRTFSERFRRLSGNNKAAFVRDLVGMFLTEMGVSNPQSYEPAAIPERFRVKKGRPKKDSKKTA